MRSILVCTLLICFISCKKDLKSSKVSNQKNITLEFNKNVEFFGYLIHLVDPENNDKNQAIKNVLDKYNENQTHPTLQKIFAEGSSYSYTYYVQLFYDLPDFSSLSQTKLDTLIEQKFATKSKEEINKRKRVANLCLQFYKESNFEKIWLDLKKYREEKASVLQRNLPSNEFILTIEDFYQKKYSNYKVVPSLTVWSSAGWGFNDLEKSQASFILGPLEKNYNFSNLEKFRDLTIHEFGHSFVNAVVLENKKLIEDTKELYKPLQNEMTKQGYGNWRDCIIEHFVRAGEIIIPQILDKNADKKPLLDFYITEKKFIHLPFIIERLKLYRLENELSYSEAVRKTLQDLNASFINI